MTAAIKPKDFKSAKDMLDWQYMVLLQQLDQVQLHAGDSTCPCRLKDMGEYCIPKHLNLVASLANETAAMDASNAILLFELGEEATDMHKKTKAHVCGYGDDIDIVTWSRNWRKKIEPLYYNCGIKGKAKLKEGSGFASLFEPAIRVSDKCAGNSAEPADIPDSLGKCKTVKKHEDGDLTVKCRGKLYVITTDGKSFEQVNLNEAPSLPVCTPSKVVKLERCIISLKAKNRSVNPFAVCQSSLGCKKPVLNEVPPDVASAIARPETVKLNENETGYCVCRDGKILLREKEIGGEAHSINIPAKCSKGVVAALVHTHPGGNPLPSRQDLETAGKLGVPVCVRTKHGVRCYKVVS